MPSFRASLRKLSVYLALITAAPFLIGLDVLAESQESPSQEPQAAVSKYDKSIFQKPIPAEQLTLVNHFVGSSANDTIRDKQFRKFLHSVLPDRTFHYGWDMSPFDAFDRVLTGSPQPVQIRDGRYVIVSSRSGPYLKGRGFIWIDMQDGIALAAFYFHPTNGEPTPTVTVFFAAGKRRIAQDEPASAGVCRDFKYVVHGSRRAGLDHALFHWRLQQENSLGA